MKIIFLILILTTTIFSDQILRIGVRGDNYPFMIDQNYGFDKELGIEICRELGYTPKFVVVDGVEGRVKNLLNRSVDIVISSFTITKERKKLLDFSIPYHRTKLSFLTDRSKGFRDYLDLDNRKITVVEGSVGEKFVKPILPQSIIMKKSDSRICKVVLDLNLCSAYFNDRSLLTPIAELDDRYMIIDSELPFAEYGIGVLKGNREILKSVNDALVKLMIVDRENEKSRLRALSDKYGVEFNIEEIDSDLSDEELLDRRAELQEEIRLIDSFLKNGKK